MDSEVLIALLSLLGTAFGAFMGNWQTRRLVTYRLEQLEKKMDRHNGLVEKVAVLERDTRTAFSKIDDLREDIRNVSKGR